VRDDLVCVAAIRGAFGVRGEVRVQSFTEDPEACFAYGPLLDAAGRPALTVRSWRAIKKGFAVRAEEIDTPEQADALKGALLHAPRAALPEPGDDEFYLSDLEGLAVRHVDGRPLGVVKRVLDYGAGDLLEIKGEGPSWLLPFTREAVPEIDVDAGAIVVDPPEGMGPDAA